MTYWFDIDIQSFERRPQIGEHLKWNFLSATIHIQSAIKQSHISRLRCLTDKVIQFDRDRLLSFVFDRYFSSAI